MPTEFRFYTKSPLQRSIANLLLLCLLPFVALTSVAQSTPSSQEYSAGNSLTPLLTNRDGLQVRVDLLTDPSTKSLDVLTFTLKEDRVGLALLAGAVKIVERGGRVRIAYDAFSSKISPETLAYLESKGVQMKAFHPADWKWWEVLLQPIKTLIRLNMRNHEKLFIVNGVKAVLGSANYSEDYFLAARDRDSRGRWIFRDREILLAGPLVERIETNFEWKWVRSHLETPETKEIPPVERSLLEKKLNDLYTVMTQISGTKPIAAQKFYPSEVDYVFDTAKNYEKTKSVHAGILKLLNSAEAEIVIENPYVLLVPDIFKALKDAKARGVVVKIFTNRVGGSDENSVSEAFKQDIVRLSKAGFEIYLIDSKQVFHGKVVIIDKKTIYLGSANFDSRSKNFNLENGIFFQDADYAALLEQRREIENFQRKDVIVNGRKVTVRTPGPVACKKVHTQGADAFNIPINPLIKLKKPLL